MNSMGYVKYFVSRRVHNWGPIFRLRKNPCLVGIKLDADSYGNFEGCSLSNQLKMFTESTIGPSFYCLHGDLSHFKTCAALKL